MGVRDGKEFRDWVAGLYGTDVLMVGARGRCHRTTQDCVISGSDVW